MRRRGKDIKHQHIVSEYRNGSGTVRGIRYCTDGVARLGFGLCAVVGHILIDFFNGTMRLSRYFVKEGFRIIGFGSQRAVLVDEFEEDDGL